MAEAAALIASASATDSEIEAALEGILLNNANDAEAFAKAFGPRRLMKLLSCGSLSERTAELADEVLTLCSGVGIGLAAELNFGEVLYRDEMFPDDEISLASPPPPPPATAASSKTLFALHLRLAGGGRAWFEPESTQMLFARGETDEPVAQEYKPNPPTLRLTTISRRARIGSEIACKIWPAAEIMVRWMWRHQELLCGQDILELGAGVGTAGLAASACGARRVIITDYNTQALKQARENCARNGPTVEAAARVAALDWARPPMLNAGATPDADAEVEAMLLRPFPLIIATDVVYDGGLSELVYRMVQLYLAPSGAFLMVCPKSKHRYMIDRLQGMLVEAEDMETVVTDVPSWLRDGLSEEAQLLEHDIVIAQWKGARRADSGVPALSLEAPAKL